MSRNLGLYLPVETGLQKPIRRAIARLLSLIESLSPWRRWLKRSLALSYWMMPSRLIVACLVKRYEALSLEAENGESAGEGVISALVPELRVCLG